MEEERQVRRGAEVGINIQQAAAPDWAPVGGAPVFKEG